MALNVDTQNVDLYPGTIKRVTVDQEKIVPVNYEGDEQFVITISTSAYSDNVNRTAIQKVYITEFDAGWCKSSGFAGTAGKFALDATHNRLNISLDATVSGSDGNGYYEIVLAYNEGGTSRTGEDVASDMEEKIRALTCVTADLGYQLAYKNASVEYKNGKLWIVSGTIGRYYTGPYRSSVKVAAGSTNDASVILGFDLPVDSETLAGTAIAEALITSSYTADTATLSIAAGTGVQAGDCLMIKDSLGQKDYFTALDVTNNDITVAVSGTNGYTGIANSYSTDNSAMVQILREQDPEVVPTPWFNDIDMIIRYGLKNVINSIDYSS